MIYKSPNWQEEYHLYTTYSPCLLGGKNATDPTYFPGTRKLHWQYIALIYHLYIYFLLGGLSIDLRNHSKLPFRCLHSVKRSFYLWQYPSCTLDKLATEVPLGNPGKPQKVYSFLKERHWKLPLFQGNFQVVVNKGEELFSIIWPD